MCCEILINSRKITKIIAKYRKGRIEGIVDREREKALAKVSTLLVTYSGLSMLTRPNVFFLYLLRP